MRLLKELKNQLFEKGNLSFLRGNERINLIKSMPVVNLDNNELTTLGRLFPTTAS